MFKDVQADSEGVCRHFHVDNSKWNKNSCHDMMWLHTLYIQRELTIKFSATFIYTLLFS